MVFVRVSLVAVELGDWILVHADMGQGQLPQLAGPIVDWSVANTVVVIPAVVAEKCKDDDIRRNVR